MRLHDVLDYHGREQPETEMATDGTRSLTYGEGLAEANRLATALIGLGVRPGDRVAILAKNCLEYVVAFFGASKAGAVLVTLNYRLTPADWAQILNDAEAKVLLIGPDFAAAVAAVRGELTTVERLIALGSERSDGCDAYRDLVDDQPAAAPDVAVQHEADMLMLYTSGTTGQPKGVPLSHQNLLFDFAQVGMTMPTGPGHRWLVIAPMFHVGGAITNVLGPIYSGASVYLMADFNPVEVVRVLDEEHIHAVLMVPAMIQACLAMVPDVAERPYAALSLLVYGASACPEPVLRRAVEVFGCEFFHGYGMTECAAGISGLTPAQHQIALSGRPELLRSVGRPFMGTEIRIADPNGRTLPVGELGEILIRGPQVTRGYWHRPEENAAAFRDGWLRSGDAGRLDAEGYLYIEDRIKDMVITGGENVFPVEVEAVVRQHPAVADVAVIGVPDERWGETVRAVVVLKPGASADGTEIVEFCRDRIAGYKRPRSVDFVAALPRNALGKVQKATLREQASAAVRS